MSKKIIIIGGEGKGGPIAATIEDNRHTFGDMTYEVAGFLNDMELGNTIHGFPVLGGTGEVARFAAEGYLFVYAIHMLGRNYKTEELFHRVDVPQDLLVNIISKRAFVAHNAVLGPGACVLVNGYVGAGAQIGACCLVAAHAFVGHDSVVGPLSHLAVCCVVGSRIEIGKVADVGINATVIEKRKIGDYAVVGAAALVTRDIPAGQIWAGSPARYFRDVGRE
jgi:sugar O-acyltransferase (sialic acid O-acetyltransferase NeuD family)